MEDKTNVMRILDKKGIDYSSYNYPSAEALSAVEVAEYLGIPYYRVYKTLVTTGKSEKDIYVVVIPAQKELDLKKAARCVNEKSVSMRNSSKLLQTTGYIHGGCSPIGMKKSFTTIIDVSASSLDSFLFSAGKIGYQVEMNLDSLRKVIEFKLCDVVS